VLALLAIGSGLTRPPLFGMLSILTPAQEQGETLGVAQSAGSLARIFGPMFAGGLFHLHPTWPYLACGAIALFTGVLAWVRLVKTESALLAAKARDSSTELSGTPGPASPILENPTESTRAASPDVAAGLPSPPSIPNYEMLRLIGNGAYGEVWLARDENGAFHAIKVVYRKSFIDSGPYDREYRGIQQYTPISRTHHGLVHILNVGRNKEAGYFYYVMELGDCEVNGQKIVPDTYCAKNLGRELDQRGTLPVKECVHLAMELAEALHYLHSKQLIHRDIKPSNIIFVNHIPKFADVGLVTHIAEKGRDVSRLGTEGFIAPEGPGTPAADVYSLGKVLYEACIGRSAAQYPEIPSTLTQQDAHEELQSLNQIINKACEPDLRHRYKSATELQTDLMHLNDRLFGGVQRAHP
jgi:serine/threonine protein kinase